MGPLKASLSFARAENGPQLLCQSGALSEEVLNFLTELGFEYYQEAREIPTVVPCSE